MTPASVMTDEQHDSYATDGFFRIDGFADPQTGQAMLDRVIELSRRAADGADISPSFVLPEAQPDMRSRRGAGRAEDSVSKIFRLARDTVFYEFATSAAVSDVVADVLDSDRVDNFLSQFIFKNPGAWGQPWHQDSFYFPFEPPRPIVGIWLAVTDATLSNGCLHVVPGSHREPVHDHIPDRREHANYGYVEIVDHDMSGAVPVLMRAGDLLVFDSHLMHCSKDNLSDSARAAMVYHYARAGTHDRTEEIRGYTVNDWMPVRREASPPGNAPPDDPVASAP